MHINTYNMCFHIKQIILYTYSAYSLFFIYMYMHMYIKILRYRENKPLQIKYKCVKYKLMRIVTICVILNMYKGSI